MVKKQAAHSETALRDKQRRFVNEYLIDLNATQAAIRAKYSLKTAPFIGAENLKKPQIQAALQKAMADREKRTEITQDKVLKELALIGFADMADFIRIDDSGMIQANPLDSLAEGKSRIIRKVKEKRIIRTVPGTKDKPDGEQILESTYEFELHDKIKSLEMIGRHLRMFDDKQGGDTESPEEKARKIREFSRDMRKATNAATSSMGTA